MASESTNPEHSQRRGRRRGRDRKPEPSLTQVSWKQPRRHFAPTELATEDQIETLHETSLQILQEIGVDFLDPESRALLDATGGVQLEEDGLRVRFDPEFVVEVIKTAPPEFTLHARNPRTKPSHGRQRRRVRLGWQRPQRQR